MERQRYAPEEVLLAALALILVLFLLQTCAAHYYVYALLWAMVLVISTLTWLCIALTFRDSKNVQVGRASNLRVRRIISSASVDWEVEPIQSSSVQQLVQKFNTVVSEAGSILSPRLILDILGGRLVVCPDARAAFE